MGNAFNCTCSNAKETENEQIFIKTPALDKSKAACLIQRQFHFNHGYSEFSNKLIEIIEANFKRENEKDIKITAIKLKPFDDQINKQTIAKKIIDQFANELNALVYEGKDNIYQLHPLEFSNDTDNEKEYYYGGWNIKGKSCGFGTLITKEGSVYKGLFNDGLFNGNGILINKKGDYYFGNWKNGECNSFGKLQLISNVKYEGEFKANEKSGEGEEYYEDGSHYHGHFSNNEKEGNGKLVFADNSYYEGNFSQSVFDGNGVYVWSDGRIYKGQFKNGQMHGNATHKWSDGSRYSGYYSNNKKQGHGVYIWQPGKELVGNWMNNEPHGNCIYFTKGKKYEIVFRFGKIISTKVISEGSTALPSPSDNPHIENMEFNKEDAMHSDKLPKKKLRIDSLIDKGIINDMHTCVLCKDLLDEPYQCLQCKKNYCYNCIYNTQSNTFKACINQCKNKFEMNNSLNQNMNSFKMNCVCGNVIRYEDRKQHIHI